MADVTVDIPHLCLSHLILFGLVFMLVRTFIALEFLATTLFSSHDHEDKNPLRKIRIHCGLKVKTANYFLCV